MQTVLKCKMCGGDIETREGMTIGTCLYCGSTMTLPQINSEKKAKLFNMANAYRMNNEFDKAYSIYESIVREDPEEAETYWGMILSEYGIEYVEDPASHRRIPTCHRVNSNLIVDSVNFSLAIQYADEEQKRLYLNEADEIDRLQGSILNVSTQIEPYQVFICYKETDDYTGERTYDSVLAQDIYDALEEKGIRTFFARISLEDKLGQNYEPYIYAALTTAKVMLVVTTNADNINAVWVKNEWMRFLQFMSVDKSKVLIPVYMGISPYDLPNELSRYQSQDMSKIGSIQELVHGIRKLLSYDNTAPIKTTSTKIQTEKEIKNIPKKSVEKSPKVIIVVATSVIVVSVGISLIIAGIVGRSKNEISENDNAVLSDNLIRTEQVDLEDDNTDGTNKLEETLIDYDAYDFDTSNPLFIKGMNYLEEKNYNAALSTFNEMDVSVPYKEYLIEATYYYWAGITDGKQAVDYYSKAGNFRDAKEKMLEAEYDMLCSFGDKRTTELIQNYGTELSNMNYKDSKEVFAEIQKWKVIGCYISDQDQSSTAENNPLETVSKYKPYYVHFKMGGGPFNNGNLKLEMDYSNGEVYTDTIYIPPVKVSYEDYSTNYYYRYWNDPSTAPDVVITTKLYDMDGNLLVTKIGEWK